MDSVRIPARELRRILDLVAQLDEALFDLDISVLDYSTRESLAKRMKREFATLARKLEDEGTGEVYLDTVLDVYLHPIGRVLEEALEEEERRLRAEA